MLRAVMGGGRRVLRRLGFTVVIAVAVVSHAAGTDIYLRRIW